MSGVSATSGRDTPLLQLDGVSKSFGANRVLDRVSFEIGRGEFVGLIGPNGAGKSTLIKILTGIHRSDSGEIRWKGKPIRTVVSSGNGAVIHQDLGLIDDMSISDNLRLGEQRVGRVGPYLDVQKERELAGLALEKAGVSRDARLLIRDLSPAEKTMVAVARALQRGAQLLIVDEATSTLGPSEASDLLNQLATLAEAGTTIIMVTHKLSEVLRSTSRVVALIDGRVVADAPRAGLDRERLVRMLAQHAASGGKKSPRAVPGGGVVLDLQAAYGGECGPVDLQIRAGEIVGITGRGGSGLDDLAFLAAGTLAPKRGRAAGPRRSKRALVPPHRETQGGFLDLSVQENLTISSLRGWRSRMGPLRVRRERAAAMQMITQLGIVPPDPAADFRVLSGGNKQKVIIGRTMLRGADLYVLCEPTRGVDVKTRAEIYRIISGLAREGAAVLVASSDVEDLFAVADRFGVIIAGELRGTRDATTLDEGSLKEML
jgi:ribose transport system ATP-binding protein